MRDQFLDKYKCTMLDYRARHMLLLIDFDDREGRLKEIKAKIPEHLEERAFILGVQSNPEALKRALQGTFEEIGSKLAIECREGKRDMWSHDLLKINESELDRLQKAVCGFLF